MSPNMHEVRKGSRLAHPISTGTHGKRSHDRLVLSAVLVLHRFIVGRTEVGRRAGPRESVGFCVVGASAWDTPLGGAGPRRRVHSSDEGQKEPSEVGTALSRDDSRDRSRPRVETASSEKSVLIDLVSSFFAGALFSLHIPWHSLSLKSPPFFQSPYRSMKERP